MQRRTSCVIILLLQAILVISDVLPALHALSPADQRPVTGSHPHQESAELQSRRPRKVPESLDTSSPVEYMTRLRESLMDSDGKPRTGEDDPTNVWCLLDKDLLDEVHRPKPSNSKCRVVHRFRFNMQALSELFHRKGISLQNSRLRTYVDVVPRYFRRSNTIPVHISGEFSIITNNLTQSIFGGQEDLVVTVESSGWVELNMTQGLKEIRSLSGLSHNLELTVTLTVDCTSNKKVPIILADPASIPLSQGPRRQRLSRLQPMLLVYLSDEVLKEEIRQEAQPLPIGENLEVESRDKRDITREGCHLEDFSVNFHNIDLDYVLAPYEYNARKCVGSCTHSVLRYQGSIATNHAKIMASAVAFRNFNPLTPFHHQPSDPCCVPTKYDSMSLLILDDVNEFNYAVYPTMTVSACGCR